jgi:hypothetical protein
VVQYLDFMLFYIADVRIPTIFVFSQRHACDQVEVSYLPPSIRVPFYVGAFYSFLFFLCSVQIPTS